MNPYLSGGLCRMTKQAACRWSTHGSQSGNLWSSNCTVLTWALLFSTVRTMVKMLTCIAHHCIGYMCTLCSVRHSPQFMGAFHSFVLECFIFSNIWTCALCTVLATFHRLRRCIWFCIHCLLFNCCIAALVLSRCSALVLTAPHCGLDLSDARSGNTPHCTSSSTYLHILFVTRSAAPVSLWLNFDQLQPAVHIFSHLSCCLPVNNIECKNAIHRKEP